MDRLSVVYAVITSLVMRRSGVRLPKAAPAQRAFRGSSPQLVELCVEPNAFYRRSMGVRAKRSWGEIEALPSGSLRVRVYAGIDPVTRKRHHLTEIIPPGPRAAKEAEKARTRLLSQVDQQRNPRSRATVNQMLDRHLEMLGVEETTLDS
jgi:hypothetical protein